ncbi:unnamed protein product [Paramecium sonneborni]|uniref:Uncharacterized protein n=1 Tax=Paramecium sonneborni TaxID=65129 RepID=A0A8S1QZI3_9CILI|nr:unnamed protein product [Paramecium sonneborni]
MKSVILKKLQLYKLFLVIKLLYEKEIKDILDEKQIKSKDYLQFDEQREFMRRFYSYFDDRIPALLEYYKYHINISRLSLQNNEQKNEKHQGDIVLQIKMELGLFEEIKQQTPSKVKQTSEDCLISKLQYLLRDLKMNLQKLAFLKLVIQLYCTQRFSQNDSRYQNLSKIIQNIQNKQVQKFLKPIMEVQRLVYQNNQETLKNDRDVNKISLIIKISSFNAKNNKNCFNIQIYIYLKTKMQNCNSNHNKQKEDQI